MAPGTGSGAKLGDAVVKSSEITARQVHVALPAGSTSVAQQAAINAAAARAEGLGVNVFVTPFR